MKKYYERYWDGTPAELADFKIKWPVLQQYIPKKKRVTLLDYGCGKGKVLSEIQSINSGLRLIGADVSKTALKDAAESVKGVTYVQIDPEQTVNLKSESVDYIVCLDVIEHVYDTEKVFLEFNRLLKKNGSLLISTPYYGMIKNVIIALIGFDVVYQPYSPHIRFYTKRSLYAVLERFGFTVLRFGTYGRFYPVNNGMYCLAQKVSSVQPK